MKKLMERDHFQKRLLMCVIGVVVCGISVGFFKRAELGVDPFQVSLAGLDALVPISFGTLSVLLNCALLLFALFADRHYIGLATFLNLLFLGYIIDWSKGILYAVFPELGMPGRAVCFLIGILILCISSAFYFTADLGVSTYDAVALIITRTWKKGEFRWVRILTDLTCVLVGLGLYVLGVGSFSGIGAMIGIGTIVTAFFMGPLVDFFNRKVAEPFLYSEE